MQEGEFQSPDFSIVYPQNMDWNDRLKIRMAELHMKPADLARASGVPYDSVMKYLKKGAVSPRGNRMALLATALEWDESRLRYGTGNESFRVITFPGNSKVSEGGNVKSAYQKGVWLKEVKDNRSPNEVYVLGEVAAGMWIDARAADLRTEEIPVSQFMIDTHYPIQAQFDLIVRGTSINRVAPDGFYLRCVDTDEAGIQAQHGDLVIVRRTRDFHLWETTARRLKIADGQQQLWPESDDPLWTEPLVIPRGEGGIPGDEITIIAVVIHIYSPAPYRR